VKFSVLLPTRNRLELLRYAIETVRRQDYGDWEVIVSDNASEEDVAGHVRSLNDPRIRYYRTESFVPVTDNWNNALAKSTGDYVVMLGDDDCLMKGYFSTLRRLIEERGAPDLVYHSALLYAYPGVMPGFPDGFVQSYSYARFLKNAREPFWLERAAALQCVRDSMDFRVTFGFNMQFALIGRRLIDALRDKGPFFQSPYPDYYAMNAALLKAERILVCPQPLVTIGISPKSFGYYYFNRSEQSGVEFLNNAPGAESLGRLEHVLLPGSEMNNSWLIAMETLRVNYGAECGLEVNYGRYRLLQIFQTCMAMSKGGAAARPRMAALWGKLRLGEKCAAAALWALAKVAGLLPGRARQKVNSALMALAGVYPRYAPRRIVGRYRSILEVYEGRDEEFLGQ
jgi:glycosyltransferase involved in cell wall biosynthesis